MSLLFCSLAKIRTNSLSSLKLFLNTNRQQLSKAINKKRLYSTEQKNTIAEKNIQNDFATLSKKLAENKEKHILIFTCTSKGSTIVNSIGLAVALMMVTISYNSWFIFQTFKIKSKPESGFFGSIISIIGTDAFRYGACFAIGLIG